MGTVFWELAILEYNQIIRGFLAAVCTMVGEFRNAKMDQAPTYIRKKKQGDRIVVSTMTYCWESLLFIFKVYLLLPEQKFMLIFPQQIIHKWYLS